MSLIPIGPSFVDPCDVAAITPSSAGSVVLLGDGRTLSDATLPAVLAAAVNAANAPGGPLLFELPNAYGYTGIVYVSGQQVVRVDPANAGNGCTVQMRNGPTFYDLTLTVAACVLLVGATDSCGGGGGGGGATQAGVWTPGLVDLTGVLDIQTVPGVRSFFTVIPGTLTLVEISAVFVYNTLIAGTPDVRITGLPYAVAGGDLNPMQDALDRFFYPGYVSPSELSLTSTAALAPGNGGPIYFNARYETVIP